MGSREKNRAKHPKSTSGGAAGESRSCGISVDDIVHTIQQPVPAIPSLTYPLPPPSFRQIFPAMRVSARPTIASFRQIISRRFASTEAQNPQVKAAVESATKAYDNALGSAKRVAGPIGERVGSMMGGECCARSIGWKGDRSVAASRSCQSEPHIPYNPLTTYHLFRLDIPQATKTPSSTTSRSSPRSPVKSTSPRRWHPRRTSRRTSTRTPTSGPTPSRPTFGRGSLRTDSGPRLESS